jgi:hypothetical protein
MRSELTKCQRFEDAGTSKDSAALIWLHALAIGLSPLYVEQNGEAVRSDWPRIPLPASAAMLRESAAPGVRAAALLNPHTAVSGVDAAPVDPRLRTVAVIERADGQPLNPGTGDLAVTAGWGIVQARAVMPGAGKYNIRERSAADGDGLTDQDRDMLGDQVLDIYLNDYARWRGVPGAAWRRPHSEMPPSSPSTWPRASPASGAPATSPRSRFAGEPDCSRFSAGRLASRRGSSASRRSRLPTCSAARSGATRSAST